MKPSRFIQYAERKLGRPLSDEERAVVLSAREASEGKREAVKSMRAALEVLLKGPL